MKVLGVILENGLKFDCHIRTAANSAKSKLLKMFLEVPKLKTLPFKDKLIIYNSVYCGTVTYAAPVWAERARVLSNRDVLRSSQRTVLIKILHAYNTASTASLPVIAGVLPIDLRLRQLSIVYNNKRNATATSKAEVRSRVIMDWQAEWDVSPRARITHSYFPDLTHRMAQKWLSPDKFTVQALTGHGDFQERLEELGLVQDPFCEDCGEVDTAVHAIFECPFRPAPIYLPKDSLPDGTVPWFENADQFQVFQAYVRLALRNRYATRAQLVEELKD